jgi:hypothetical protein
LENVFSPFPFMCYLEWNYFKTMSNANIRIPREDVQNSVQQPIFWWIFFR